ncbi:peptidase [Candidatus Bathyarchaeota archaeon]|nr:peptidase [Candidatus Bathyarchaeota archaeon]
MIAMTDFHKEKADEALDILNTRGADALLLFPGADIGYYTGFSIGPSERLAAALIPFSGNPVLVVNQLEAELRGQKSWITDVDLWLEHEDPVEILAENFERLDLEDAVVAINEDAPWGWINRLIERLPKLFFVDATSYMSQIRMVKSQQELDWMRMACAITDKALEVGFGNLHTGLTERELAGILTSEIRSNGGGAGFVGVLFGERAALPHGRPGERELEPGDCVLVDLGTNVHGYSSDLTRTVFYGKPSTREAELYALVNEANQIAYKAVRPGVSCGELDSIARKVIDNGGCGEYFIHRLGHGIGLQVHERPYIVQGNELELEAGMTFTIEPGIYIVGEIGIRVEDTVVCTAGGCERLTRLTRELTFYPIKD